MLHARRRILRSRSRQRPQCTAIARRKPSDVGADSAVWASKVAQGSAGPAPVLWLPRPGFALAQGIRVHASCASWRYSMVATPQMDRHEPGARADGTVTSGLAGMHPSAEAEGMIWHSVVTRRRSNTS